MLPALQTTSCPRSPLCATTPPPACATPRGRLPSPGPQGTSAIMKNLPRVRRPARPYRYRLALSVLAATCAAVLWGTNFTSIYPVLKLLHTGKSLHVWIEGSLAETQKEIDLLSDKVDKLS